MAVKFQDYYQTLGVKRDASSQEIQRAYRRLARQYHPDVNKSAQAETKFKQISEAYEVLKDAAKRRRYDRLGQDWKAGQEFRPPPGSGFEGFENFQFAGGPGAHGFSFQGGGQFSDFFEALFGQTPGHPGHPENPGNPGNARSRGGGPFQQHRAGDSFERPQQEASIVISLAEAHRGTTRSLALHGPQGNKTVTVKIPAGTRPGQKIRLRGEGVVLQVNLAPDPRFIFDADQLIIDVSISPALAALGGKIDVPTLDGDVTLTIPPASSSGAKLRLKAKGLGGADLLARLKIVIPTNLTDPQRRLYQQLLELEHHTPPESPH